MELPKPYRFPRFLLRYEPYLEKGELNPIFQAFQSRRRYKGNLSLLTRRFDVFRVPIGYTLIILLAIIPAAICLGIFVFIVPIILIPLLQARYSKRAIQSSILPKSLRRVFSGTGYYENPAIDLWMTGNDGRTVLEAMYLEQRVQYIRQTGYVGCFLFALVMGIVLYYWTAPLWLKGITSITCLIILAEAWFFGFAMNAIASMQRVVQDTQEYWKGSIPTGNQMLRGIAGLFVSLPVVILLIVGFIIMSSYISTSFKTAGYQNLEMVNWAIINIIMAVVLHGSAILVLKFTNSRLPASIDASDFPYDRFMAHVVMKDQVGDAWARWKHQVTAERKLAVNTPPPPPRT